MRMTSKNILFSICFILALVHCNAFAPASSIGGGSDFVVSQRPRSTAARPPILRHSFLQMGSMAKFGIFSPAVYAAKIALGEKKLNTIRGKAISLHSQYIGEFCVFAGAYHLRTKLIKKAKTNGDNLGFLV
mmetsp:Transcript_19499/g.27796  ORF Transcript_19499/g.27796 Transcript_19499/m.27796 type:complete len:131 (+) Transcript_19499:121-513(+)